MKESAWIGRDDVKEKNGIHERVFVTRCVWVERYHMLHRKDVGWTRRIVRSMRGKE